MRKIYQLKLILLSIFLSLYVFAFSAPAFGAQVTYCSHIANVGWLSWVSDGQTSGSPGSGNQMEAVQIKTAGFPSTYHIDYQAHVSYIGWQGWVSDGQTAGTTGQEKAIEAIQIKLRGFPSNYHVKYRAYVQNIGWQGWVSDGATAGTTGQGKAIEALAVIIYADPPNISSINPTQIGAGIFDLTINGSNFDSGAVDQIFWKATGAFVGQGTILSRSSTRLVVREFMEGTNPGTYVVKVKNSDGQISSGIDLEIVNQPPKAKITMISGGQTAYENETLNLSVVPGGTAHVDFSASRSSDPDGSVTSYQWYINGQPEYTTRDCDHDFPAGTHQILLKVWDNQGAQGAVGASIIIEEIPAPHITSISPTKIGAGTFDLTINGSNFDNDGAVDKIFWKAEDRFVGQGTILSRSSTRLVVREFMEGTSPGTYVVRVENPDKQISNGIDLEIINQLPVAGLSMTSQGQTVYENGTLNLTVTPGGTTNVNFSASRSSDPDGSISSYQWRINGEPVSTSRDFDYVLEAGTHQILLEVWDNQGAQGAVGATIIIGENQLPVAGLSMTSQGQTVYENGTLNLTVTPGGTTNVNFSASRSSDPDGSISSYQWRINGEPVSTSRDFDYVLDVGTHQILLEVWDNQGAQGAVGASIIISEDNIVYLDNGIVRVGVDLAQGGAIVEISHDGYNLIDTNDPGRLIQVSLWDDVNPNWNPIQAGDITGHLNPVTEYSSDSNSIYTKARGINWLNTSSEPEWLDVDIEQWVTLEDQKVKVKYRVTHFGSDEHILHHQEFPSVYLRTELSDSITYSGDNPWNSDQVEFLGILPGQSKFVMPTEHWASFVNAEDFGLTIYSPYHTLLWKAERILGVSDPNYIAIVDQFGLTSGSVHETEVYFIVGNYPDSRQLIYNLELQNNAPKIDSIDPATIEPSDFTLKILGSNFDQAIDQIYWKNDGHFVGQAPETEIISRSETKLVVTEKMAGAEPGAYLVTVRNSDGKLSNFVEMFVGNLVPLFRGYSCDDSDHFYTTDIVERNNLPTYGYTYEKIEAYISNAPFSNGVPLYRLYHETRKSHYYTTSTDEKESKILEGFKDEGITGYVYQEPSENMVPIYHLYNSSCDDHFYTISEFERDNAVTKCGYTDEGIAMYVARNSSASPLSGRPVAEHSHVDLSSGNFRPYYNHVDFANPPGIALPFVFARTYNALNAGESGPLGPGWSHNYNIRIVDTEQGQVIVRWGDGRNDYYNVSGDSYTSYPGIYDSLVKSGSNYILTRKDMTQYTFEDYSPKSARLIKIEDKNNNTVTLKYDESSTLEQGGNLIMVKDGSGRDYQFHYSEILADITEGSKYRLESVSEQNVLNRNIRFNYSGGHHRWVKK